MYIMSIWLINYKCIVPLSSQNDMSWTVLWVFCRGYFWEILTLKTSNAHFGLFYHHLRSPKNMFWIDPPYYWYIMMVGWCVCDQLKSGESLECMRDRTGQCIAILSNVNGRPRERFSKVSGFFFQKWNGCIWTHLKTRQGSVVMVVGGGGGRYRAFFCNIILSYNLFAIRM